MTAYILDNKGTLPPTSASRCYSVWPDNFVWTNQFVKLRYLVAPTADTGWTTSSTTPHNGGAGGHVFYCPEGVNEVATSPYAAFPSDGKNHRYWARDESYSPGSVASWYALNTGNPLPVGGTATDFRDTPFVLSTSADVTIPIKGEYKRTENHITKPSSLVMTVEASRPTPIG